MNSIFRKQFVVYMGTLFLSLIILGGGLTKAFGSYLTNQKKDLLINQGEKISNAFIQTYYTGGLYDRGQLNREIAFLNEYLDASFFFINNKFTIKVLSNDIDQKWLDQTLDLNEIKPVTEGSIVVMQNKLRDIFDANVLTIGYPIIDDGQFIGAIFMASPITELQKARSDAFLIIIVSIFFTAVIGFILIYIFSKKISKPLLAMNGAAKIISNGDFEKRINVSSKDEIGQLAESFNEMAESLYNQEQRRREFISNISHDIRSPLTSMRGFLRAMSDETIPPQKHAHYLGIVLDESERLSLLADNILHANSAPDSDYVINRTDFDINELIRTTVMKFETSVINKRIKMKVVFCDERTIVTADYEKIQRVIYNLADNAVKFTPENGEIAINTSLNLNGNKVVIKIKDSGCGISPNDQKRVFERFYKADASRGCDKLGSGLGLSIVKEFIKAHDETITLKSELNNGSEFSFSLKLAD